MIQNTHAASQNQEATWNRKWRLVEANEGFERTWAMKRGALNIGMLWYIFIALLWQRWRDSKVSSTAMYTVHLFWGWNMLTWDWIWMADLRRNHDSNHWWVSAVAGTIFLHDQILSPSQSQDCLWILMDVTSLFKNGLIEDIQGHTFNILWHSQGKWFLSRMGWAGRVQHRELCSEDGETHLLRPDSYHSRVRMHAAAAAAAYVVKWMTQCVMRTHVYQACWFMQKNTKWARDREVVVNRATVDQMRR